MDQERPINFKLSNRILNYELNLNVFFLKLCIKHLYSALSDSNWCTTIGVIRKIGVEFRDRKYVINNTFLMICAQNDRICGSIQLSTTAMGTVPLIHLFIRAANLHMSAHLYCAQRFRIHGSYIDELILLPACFFGSWSFDFAGLAI